MVKIIFEDKHFLAVDKPCGMLTIPTPAGETNTLTAHLNRELEKRGLKVKAHPCHRLDRETSGIILYAKGKKAQQEVMDLFHKREIKKKYIAFVRGVLAKKSAVISLPIENKPAETAYRVLEERKDFTVVEIEPKTGRTNQIRIHFRKINHPLLGETKYAFRKDFKVNFKRLALHASELELIHPQTGEKLRLSSPLPEDMRRFLNSGTH